jgi:hypothetical protein
VGHRVDDPESLRQPAHAAAYGDGGADRGVNTIDDIYPTTFPIPNYLIFPLIDSDCFTCHPIITTTHFYTYPADLDASPYLHAHPYTAVQNLPCQTGRSGLSYNRR